MKKLLYLFMIIALASCAKTDDGTSTTTATTEKRGGNGNNGNGNNGNNGNGNNPLPPPPPVAGVELPAITLTNIVVVADAYKLSLSFDAIAGVDCYTLYYKQDPQPANITNGITINGVWYRQVTSCYPTLPMYAWYGYAPINSGVIYPDCKVGIYFTNGDYSYSESFQISTVL